MITKTLAVCIIFLMFAHTLFAQSTSDKPMDHSKMDHSAHTKVIADAERQAEVAQRSKDVMPFSLAATTHIFSKRTDGGIQQVIAKKSRDESQVILGRQHLQQIREKFLRGDFSGPSQIHGQSMPGLAELVNAKPGQITFAYKDVSGGAALVYKTSEPTLVSALHKWFDAQLADHGKDAKEDHHHRGDMKLP